MLQIFINMKILKLIESVIDERDDINTANNYSAMATDLLNKYFENIGQYILKFYPLKIKNVDALYWESTQYPDITRFKYNDLTFGFAYTRFNNSSAQYNPKAKVMTVYNDEIYSKISAIKKNVMYYLDDSTENIKNRKNIRVEVVNLYEELLHFDYSDILNSIIHELVHHYDSINGHLKDDIIQAKLRKSIEKYKNLTNLQAHDLIHQIYINSNHEYNAYFIATVADILEQLNGTVPTWDFMMKKLRAGFPWLNKIKPEQKNRFIKRLYDLWIKLKEKSDINESLSLTKLFEQLLKENDTNLILFHGSSSQSKLFENFKDNQFFTTNDYIAHNYAYNQGGYLYETKVNSLNPFGVFDNQERLTKRNGGGYIAGTDPFWIELLGKLYDKNTVEFYQSYGFSRGLGNLTDNNPLPLCNYAKQRGYDSLKFVDESFDGFVRDMCYIIFDGHKPKIIAVYRVDWDDNEHKLIRIK